MGMGKRSAAGAAIMSPLQTTPVTPKSWTDHGIPSRWAEKVDRRRHPHIKPTELTSRLIGAVTQPGDLVVDPAAGSFVVLEIAGLLGRRFIGCDAAWTGKKSDGGCAMTRYLGVDPGLSGALAIIETINSVPVLIDAIDMPVTGTGAKARVDIIAVAEMDQRSTHHRSPMSNARRHFRGRALPRHLLTAAAVGAIEAVVALCPISLHADRAAVWKRKLHLPGKDKEAARQRALQLFPATTRAARTEEGSRPR